MLLQPNEAARARACYNYPPIGSYTEHASECDPKNFGDGRTRPSGFDSGENPCHGTRMFGDVMSRPKSTIQWTPKWQDRPWIKFEDEAVLHSAEFNWKSFEDENAAFSRAEWQEWCRNPGNTKREKRMFRAFMTKMNKRHWTSPQGEAKCV